MNIFFQIPEYNFLIPEHIFHRSSVYTFPHRWVLQVIFQLVVGKRAACRMVVDRLVVGKLTVDKLASGRLVLGRLVAGRWVVGRWVAGRLV